jgi:hypothetical protein
MIEKCNRCGRCCTYIIDGIEKRCKFLIGIVGKTTACRIYKSESRLGTKIDEMIYCVPREYDPRNFTGCKYNR